LKERPLSESIVSPPPGAGRLSTPRILAFATSGIPTAMMVLMVTVYMPRFYAGHIGIPLAAVGVSFTIVRLIDIAFDPFIGTVMDRTRTALGRYRLWMIIATPILMGSLWMLFTPPDGAGRGYLILWLLIYYAGNSIFVLAHAAWAAAIATSYHERSRVYGWMQAIGVIGSVSLLLLPIFTQGRITPGKGESMVAIGWIIVALLPLTTAVVTTTTPERLAQEAGRTRFPLKDYWDTVARPAMRRIILADLFLALGPGTTSPIYIFFFKDAKAFTVAEISFLLVFYIGAGLIGAPVWARVARRFGKHRTLIGSTVCYAVAQTILMAIPKGLLIPTAVGMFSVGFCASAFVLLIRAMVADVADEVRLEQGKERVGLMYAMITSTQKVGAAISVTIIFTVLQLVGYQASDKAVNTQGAIFGLEMCYLFAPIILVLVGGAMLVGYKLDAAAHAKIRTALEERERGASMESPILESLTGSQALPDIPVEPKAS
jgi:GPH family glycoside/pentoside/hexuronide:cation symporter